MAAKPDCTRYGCAAWPVKASLRRQYTKKSGTLFRKPGFPDAADVADAADAAGADRGLRGLQTGGRSRPQRGLLRPDRNFRRMFFRKYFVFSDFRLIFVRS